MGGQIIDKSRCDLGGFDRHYLHFLGGRQYSWPGRVTQPFCIPRTPFRVAPSPYVSVLLESATMCGAIGASYLMLWKVGIGMVSSQRGRGNSDPEDEGMEAFDGLLAGFMERAKVSDKDHLVEEIARIATTDGDPPFSREWVAAALRGWMNPHPAFYGWLEEALDLTEVERTRLTWTHLMRNDNYSEDWSPPASPARP